MVVMKPTTLRDLLNAALKRHDARKDYLKDDPKK